jgi:hypothetical protein
MRKAYDTARNAASISGTGRLSKKSLFVSGPRTSGVLGAMVSARDSCVKDRA